VEVRCANRVWLCPQLQCEENKGGYTGERALGRAGETELRIGRGKNDKSMMAKDFKQALTVG